MRSRVVLLATLVFCGAHLHRRILLILNILLSLAEMDALPGNAISYYDPRTLYSGSGEPLSAAKPTRNLPRTGWGPRGDSGPERDRVRATQPANLRFPSLPSPKIQASFLALYLTFQNSKEYLQRIASWSREL